jgi:DNA polymerase I-like protein with 3'-5' exonuclease and polymerase domains
MAVNKARELIANDVPRPLSDDQIQAIDEIVAEAREDIANEAAAIIEEQMVAAGEKLLTKVPVKVDVYVSDCWEKG